MKSTTETLEMVSIPTQNQNSEHIIWKKVFSVMNVPEKVKHIEKKIKWTLLIGVGGGILLFMVSLLLFLPISGTRENPFFGVCLTGISFGITIPITVALPLNQMYTIKRDLKLLSTLYSEIELAAYEESLTIMDQVIVLKIAKNVGNWNHIPTEHLAGVNKDTWSINVKDLNLIQFGKIFNKYILVLFTRETTTSSTEKSIDLVDYYSKNIPGVRYNLNKLIAPYYFTKEDVNRILQILTSFVPHVRVQARF